MPDLDNRIATSLVGNTSSGDLAQLVEETTKALADASAAHDAWKHRALDPKAPTKKANISHCEMQRAQFRADRLSIALADLNDRLTHVINAEREADAAQKLKAAEDRQRAAAGLLRDRYPILAAEIADILAECVAADRQAAQAGIRNRTSTLAGWPGLRNPLEAIKLPTPTVSAWPRKGWAIR